MDGLWMVYEWFMDGLWMIYGWFMDGLWMVYEWFMDDLWMVYGWFMDGLLLITEDCNIKLNLQRVTLFQSHASFIFLEDLFYFWR